jgi:hypothetical protein
LERFGVHEFTLIYSASEEISGTCLGGSYELGGPPPACCRLSLQEAEKLHKRTHTHTNSR